VICNYPGPPRVAAATWPCIYLFIAVKTVFVVVDVCSADTVRMMLIVTAAVIAVMLIIIVLFGLIILFSRYWKMVSQLSINHPPSRG